MSLNAIVLTGGGARAAYQVGATRALYEIVRQDEGLFRIVTGTSAGAINASYLAAHANNWDVATSQLWDLWGHLRPQDIFDLGALSISKLGSQWLSGAALGGLAPKRSGVNHLLDTTPLRRLLEREIDFADLNRSIADGTLEGLALSTTNFFSGASVVFHNGPRPVDEWARTDRFSVRSPIEASHVMASSAIPLFFPPEPIGDSWYGDGCVRQTTPLSPAIHLGADRIIAIGIRAPHTPARQRERTLTKNRNPSLGQIVGVMMNAVFLDAMEADVERLSRVNETIFHMSEDARRAHFPNLRPLPILMLRPSQDLGAMTAQLGKELPPMLRYLLKGIGVGGSEGLDLLSYLAFDKSYTRPLIDLGYQDTMARTEEIKRFLEL